MTRQEIQKAIKKYGSKYVRIIFNDKTEIKGTLQNTFPVIPNDPRHFTKPYFSIFRIDTSLNEVKFYNCDEVESIEAI